MAAEDATAGEATPAVDSRGPILETEGLTRTFGQFVAVDDVDLAVERGEVRSIIGPNGAGKTTLFNLITGELAPSAGVVRFDGEDVSGLPAHERVRRGIGRSFQITTVFGRLSVRENVRLAAQAVRQDEISLPARLFRPTDRFVEVGERADEVLAAIGLADRAAEPASALPYGDRRRLELGLVLATDPELVLLDEPTAGMSPEQTDATMALVGEVLADRTLVLIEHDIDLVMSVSDRVTVLHQGSVLTTGTPEAVAADEAVQAAYLGGVE